VAPDRRLTLARAERRRLAAVAAIVLVPFALLAVWARVASPAPWEPDVLRTLALGSDPAADVIRAINTLGNLPIWAALAAVVAAAAYVLRGIVAAMLVALTVAADLVAALVKVFVERLRPEGAIVDSLIGADSYAFPSGHVVRAVALLAVVAWLLAPPGRRLGPALVAAIAAGLLMGFCRVALGVHWPTDALGGLLLGVGWFAVTTLALGRGMELQPAPKGRG
jgi:undecaprenyl-diphosphatase